ncbi:hypothetical protein D3C71_1977220 [compost metagenome]
MEALAQAERPINDITIQERNEHEKRNQDAGRRRPDDRWCRPGQCPRRLQRRAWGPVCQLAGQCRRRRPCQPHAGGA